ncbi:iduronate 2-sulfatase [Tribolium castaneum]|uniref:Iduronate 2-sulfatase-like Protein n=1 Tax=Tribolium castaneum TaxID=7070 RepID=D6WDU1_TRICA|nr:PREDICTED: iduronate 2-sulfatase [Tribolium castaneum]EFA00827.1 Iduronate 2-sulfatase-like Protein [Tribolium castaneum]|eukprot:XP_967324.1 PREDICTED: iduronate 2-sulfatase [Tribolium castaneum]
MFALVLIGLLVRYSVALKPNVLMVMIDDLRPALGLYGDPDAYSPNIDKLATKSFVFTNVFAQQALCAPSRNSLLTSRRPDSLHLYDFYSYWRDSVGNFTTLPQLFKDHGYYTHSIGKIFHPGISSNYTDDSPYSWSDKPFHPQTEKYKEAKVCVTSDGTFARNVICPVIVDAQPGGTLPDLESLAAAKKFLKSYKGEKPYFLAVGFHKPHLPLKFPVEYLDYHQGEVELPVNRWRPPLLPTVAWNPWLDVKNRDDIKKLNISFPFGGMPDNVTKEIIRNYNAATSYIDSLVGSLLDEVDSNNTIIVLTSDHGWSRGEHGEFSKFSNFDVATRVPLIVHVPGLSNAEIRITQLVELVDLFPTLVDLTQVAPALEVCTKNGSNSILCTEGQSLVPIMVANARNQLNKAGGKRAVFSQYPRPGAFPSVTPDSDRPRLEDINIMGYSIRTTRYRYTEWIKFNHTTFMPDWSKVYGKELYDHLIDPLENMNLVTRSELSYVIDSMHKQLILGWRFA